MDLRFHIFGSEDSQDYDVIVEVDKIPDIHYAQKMCDDFDVLLSSILTDKPLNTNLGVFRKGTLIDVFKGTVDELVNCIYYTHSRHDQFFKNPIKKQAERDIDLKIIRVARFLITFYSRTELRIEIKKALRGDLKDKLQVLKKLDYTKMLEFPMKKERKSDIYKVVAFQFGQVFSLIDGNEKYSYTKNDMIKKYPDLRPFLKREELSDDDFKILNKYLKRYIDLIELKIEKGIELKEYK